MRYLNALHLSDLHLKPADTTDRYAQSLVMRGLLEIAAKLADSSFRPDLVMFSGDLVNAADDTLFPDVVDFLNELARTLGLSASEVLLCPGNHDASRNAIGVAIPALHNFRQKARESDGANALALDQKFVQHVGNVFGSLATLYQQFGKEYEVAASFLARSYQIDHLGLGVVSINTASLTGSGLTNDLRDERQLVMPELSLDRALNALRTDIPKIVMGHHPLSYLTEENEVIIKTVLQKNAAVYVSGHLHRATPEFVTSPQGTTTYLQSGSLYAIRKWWNGVGIISIDPAKPEYQRICYKKWHEERREFGVASEFDDEGLVYSSEDAEKFWKRMKPRLSPRVWDEWRESNLKPFVTEECAKDLSKVFEQSRFVEPEFERDRYVATDQGIEKAAQPEIVSFEDLRRDSGNVVIFAQSESGKTTLIREWARRDAGDSASTQAWRIPVILKFSNIKNSINQIERLVKQSLPDLPEGISHVDLLENGRLTIIVDDVKLANIRDSLSEFITKYNANRFVFLTGSVYLQGAGIVPVIVEGMDFGHVRLRQLKTSQVLALIENHGMRDPQQADRLLQRMMVEATSLNVPITPVTGSFLIQIYTEDQASSLVNKANLLERYIEISLEKFGPAELLPSSFDFRNKSDLLSYIASKMARLEVYQASESDIISWINEYLAEYGLRFSTIDLLNYFVVSRIFERSDGNVSFRLNAFFEYFVAARMAEDESFREFVLSEDSYLRYPNEISFYAAISRKDVTWLDEIYRRFKKHDDEVKSGSVEGGHSRVMETFVLPAPSDGIAELKAIEDKAFNEPLTEDERRQALDDDIPPMEVADRPVSRSSQPDDSQKWVSQLTMLSAMLKNMELVPTAKKKEILDFTIQAWLEFVAMSMRIVPTLAEQRRLRFAGVDYVVAYPAVMNAGELARRLYLFMPISTAKIATYHLGTEKLRVQLEDGIGPSSDESPSSQFFRGAILAQLGVDDLPDILKGVAKAIEGKRYLQEVFFRLLAEVVIRYRLPESERLKLSNLAADLRVELEGQKGTRAVRRKSAVMRSLESSRLRVQVSSKGQLALPDRKN